MTSFLLRSVLDMALASIALGMILLCMGEGAFLGSQVSYRDEEPAQGEPTQTNYQGLLGAIRRLLGTNGRHEAFLIWVGSSWVGSYSLREDCPSTLRSAWDSGRHDGLDVGPQENSTVESRSPKKDPNLETTYP